MRCQRIRMSRGKPKHLHASPQGEAQLRDDWTRLQPSPRWRRWPTARFDGPVTSDPDLQRSQLPAWQEPVEYVAPTLSL
jgi:hypothetical protein